jgi:predicted alpha/beta hydrolase family esterase
VSHVPVHLAPAAARPDTRSRLRQAVPLIVPGWKDSGSDHWQSAWQDRFGAERVRQDDWNAPSRQSWVQGLQRAIAEVDRPVLLIAHSLGCIAIAHWARTAPGIFLSRRLVRGALLVAPADVERAGISPALHDFAPIPMRPLPFAATVVASDTDPYCSLSLATALARAWQARLHRLGDAGHINAESGHRTWADGLALLQPFDGWPVAESC